MKKTVPNVRPASGVSRDYKIAFGSLTNYLERIRDKEAARTQHLAKRAFLHRHLLRYEEHFDPEIYEDVVTDANREVVAKINAIIDTVNELRKTNVLDYDRLKPLEQELLELIAGVGQPPA